MNTNHQLAKRLIHWALICLLTPLLVNCSKNYHEYDAVFYPSTTKLTKYSKIVVLNEKPNDLGYRILENALKSKLTEVIPGNLKPMKDITVISKDLATLGYSPKLETLDSKKIAYLSFKITAKDDVKRSRVSKTIRLKKCNYLKKKDKCSSSVVAKLVTGEQAAQMSFAGEIQLKNSSGEPILPTSPFNVVTRDKGRIVQSSLSLTKSASDKVANDYISRIIPYKKKVKMELLDDGDELAVVMIQNRAYNMAVNRLDKIVSKRGKDPVSDDYYHLGVAYEALNEVSAATEAYEMARRISPKDQNIKKALGRTKNIKTR
ncbi:MAG: hypothetical protein GY786_01290 [Proteobacteria bacterium]|nr:hypothetical protein [Pseudomonadota bacterium]